MRLLVLGSEDIGKYLDQMEQEVNEIKAGCLRMSWYMRGGVSYTDVLNMSMTERDSINKLINDNLETTKNSKLPFF